ncbi:Tetratricopeptide repeat (TPR)-like superfamily protein [Euphorbia peplus]|nr:Tetratricopeptide repeat (TPR)-like superfamily protein [Euphorbia peplus]
MFGRMRSLVREISIVGARNGWQSNLYSSKSTRLRKFLGPMSDLFLEISPIEDPDISILPILEQWSGAGRPVDKDNLIEIVRELRWQRRYSHAAEVSIWMTVKGYSELTSSAVAVRLDLIAKSEGIEQAEKYFNNVAQQLKGFHVYGALLNCYARAECVEKSEAVSRKMRDLGFAKRTLQYNVMLSLYYKTQNMGKFNALLQEMEENGVVHNRCTVSILLSAYAAVMDVEGIDKAVALMESDPKVATNWKGYNNAATGYRRAGLFDKALEMLKKAEACFISKRFDTYNYLLTQYASIGRKDEVLRVWSLYKKKYKVYNKGYERILRSLVKLEELEIAENILDEWESQDLEYDMRIPNVMIGSYCQKGLFEKAEVLIDRAISRGAQPDGFTWYYFATGYFQNDQPEKAVEMMKKAIACYVPLHRPSNKYLAACLEHMKGVGDVEDAEGFIKLLSAKRIICLDIQEKLLNNIKAKQTVQNGTMQELPEP